MLKRGIYLLAVLSLIMAWGAQAQTSDTSSTATSDSVSSGETSAVSPSETTTGAPGHKGTTPLERRTNLREQAQERRAELKEKTEGRRAELQQKKEELKNRVEAKRAERIKAFVKHMMARFEAAIKRLENLYKRIDSRLDKLAELGKDVSAYRTMLDGAKAKIEVAKTLLASTRRSLEAISISESPRAQFESAKTDLNEVKAAIKEAHAALVDVINSIRGASGAVHEAATTTPSEGSTNSQ